jgi:diguanylate cyclase
LRPKVRIEHLAVLIALIVGANVLLLAALALPRMAARRLGQLATNGAAAGGHGPAGEPSLAPAELYDGAIVPSSLYERVVRVVSYSFIGAALLVVTLTGLADEPLTYVVLALGAFIIVLAQDVLPLAILGRWRYPLEAVIAIIFVSLLVVLTGGHQSPFFFGYLLLLAGASAWAEGFVPFILALLASAAYLLAVALAPTAVPIGQAELGIVGFNLVALALVSYVAAVVGREQRRAREAALRLSRFDALTGLHTRGYFDAAIEREIVRAQRTGRPFSLLMLDADRLKPINDQFGHEAGDRLLRGIAESIKGGIRASDFAARYGGDEFVIVLPDTDLPGARRVGEKLRFDISRLGLQHNADRLDTSVSIGLVTYPLDGRTSAELMRRADLALFEAKRRGRNQIVHFVHPDEEGPLEDQPRAPWENQRAPWDQPRS